MKHKLIIIVFTTLITIDYSIAAKPLKGLHATRRLPQNQNSDESYNFSTRIAKKTERRLSLFGPTEIEREMDDATEHTNMVMMMNMMDKNAKIQSIMKNVKQFIASMDDLHESVGYDIEQLSSVARNYQTKKSALGTI